MSEMMTLAEFMGSVWYYVVLGAAVVVLLIILKVVKGRAG